MIATTESVFSKYKASAVIKYKEEFLIISKEIDTPLGIEESGIKYSVLPYYTIALLCRKEILNKRKGLNYKIRTGEIVSDKASFVNELRGYLDFIIRRYRNHIDFASYSKIRQSISQRLKNLQETSNIVLKEIQLNAIKEKIIHLYDIFYFTADRLEIQIERDSFEMTAEESNLIKSILSLNINLPFEEIKNKVISATQFSFTPDFNRWAAEENVTWNQMGDAIILLKTNLPYDEFVLDFRNMFMKSLNGSVKLYMKYSNVNRVIIFEASSSQPGISTAKGISMLAKKFMDEQKVTGEFFYSTSLGDIWDMELADQRDEKFELNNALLNIPLHYRDVWTQDYAVSISIVLLSKFLKRIFSEEDALKAFLERLDNEWNVHLCFENGIKDVTSFIKKEQYSIAAMIKQIDGLENDMALLATYVENEPVNNNLEKAATILASYAQRNSVNSITKERLIIDLCEEVCGSLGLYLRNQPYVSGIISKYKPLLWTII